MKNLLLTLLSLLILTSCVEDPRKVEVVGKVAVVYTNGDKDTISVNQVVESRDTSRVGIRLVSLDGGICAVIDTDFRYLILVSGVRKMEVINLNKSIK